MLIFCTSYIVYGHYLGYLELDGNILPIPTNYIFHNPEHYNVGTLTFSGVPI